MTSEDFTDLSVNYRDVRRRDINRLLDINDGAIGKVSFADIKSLHIQANRRDLSMNPSNERLKTWRALFVFAIEEGVVWEDQSGFEKKRRSKGHKKKMGHLPWTLAEIELFRNENPYGTEKRVFFETLYWTGSRISDARRFGRKDETEDGFLAFEQQKTGEFAYVPVGPDLPAFADQADYAHFRRAVDAMGPGRQAYTLTMHGRIRSEKPASNWFSAAARAAGITKTAHGLRKSRLIRNTELGQPKWQPGAVTSRSRKSNTTPGE